MENGVSNNVCKLEIDHATFEHEGYWDCALTLCKEPTARGCENPDGSRTSRKAKITVHVRIIYYLIKSIIVYKIYTIDIILSCNVSFSLV